jgi:hypothetical protein
MTQKQKKELKEDIIKKGDIWIKDDNIKYERRVEQRYGKPQKKE